MFREAETMSFDWGTDHFQVQTSEHIFAPNGVYSVYYGLNIFSSPMQFWKGEYTQAGHIQSRDVFRLIAHERKYLMDYNYWYHDS